MGTRQRKEWRLPFTAAGWVLVRASDVLEGEKALYSAPFLSGLLTRWVSDPLHGHVVRELFRLLGIDPGPQSGQASLLEKEIRRGRLALVKSAPRTAGGGGDDSDDGGGKGSGKDDKKKDGDTSGKPAGGEKTWIEIHLVDDQGDPVPGEAYRLKITDGSTRTGKLDEKGAVRVSGIDPGTCQICFPDLAANEWKPA